MTVAVLLNYAGPGLYRIVGTLPVPATVDETTQDVALWTFAQADVDAVEVWVGSDRVSAWTAEEGPGTALPDGASAALAAAPAALAV
jgi:hypothetical protein